MTTQRFTIQAVFPVSEDTAGAKFALFDNGRFQYLFDSRDAVEKKMKEITVSDHLDRSALAYFVGWRGTIPDDIKSLAEMWTPESADKYKVAITFDSWDYRGKSEEEWRAIYAAEESKSREEEYSPATTRGTIVLDGVERKWWLRACQDVHGQVISIEMPHDCDNWHLDWVMRPDWPLINFSLLDALVSRHPLTDDGDGAGEDMERLRRFESRCGFCGEWNAARSVCACRNRRKQVSDSQVESSF